MAEVRRRWRLWRTDWMVGRDGSRTGWTVGRRVSTKGWMMGVIGFISTIAVNAEMAQSPRGMTGSVTGVVGSQVSIPCDLTPPSPEDSPHLILWYKHIFGTPIYSVDMRNGVSSASHWVDNKLFGHRVHLVLEPSSHNIMSHLVINNTKLSDAGPYRCRVDFWKAPTRNVKVALSLLEEPGVPVILDAGGADVTGTVLAVRINSTLLLTCRTKGGNPLPNIRWETARQILTGKSWVSGQTVTSELVLPRLQLEDTRKVVSCLASNNNMTSPVQSNVTLDMILAPVRVEISRTWSSFIAGREYNITCQVLGSNPPPSTSIWVGSQRLEVISRKASSDGKVYSSIGSFLPNPSHDDKFVACRARNNFFPSEALEDQWKINVEYIPSSSLTATSSRKIDLNQDTGTAEVIVLKVEEGDTVTLKCQAKANPPPFDFHWRHNGEAMEVVHSLEDVGLAEVHLGEVGVASGGNYSCVAENKLGMGQSNVLILDVLYSPSCQLNSTQLLSVSVHESVDLECSVAANPPSLTFHWSMTAGADPSSGSVVDIPASQFTHHGTRSVLTFTPRTPKDFGVITCRANNDLGLGLPCSYVVSKKVEHSGVRDCHLTAKHGVIQLRCREEPPSAAHLYIAELVDIDLGLTSSLAASKPSFQFNSVRPGSVFTLSVYVRENGQGERRLVHSVVVPTMEEKVIVTNAAPNQGDQHEHLLPIIGGLGGLLLLLLLVSILIVVVIRSRDDHVDKHMRTHIAFNKSLDLDIEPDVIPQSRQGSYFSSGLSKIHSLDQLNNVSFEGFSAGCVGDALIDCHIKYNTLPSRQMFPGRSKDSKGIEGGGPLPIIIVTPPPHQPLSKNQKSQAKSRKRGSKKRRKEGRRSPSPSSRTPSPESRASSPELMIPSSESPGSRSKRPKDWSPSSQRKSILSRVPQLEELSQGDLALPPLVFMPEEKAQVKKVTFEERDSLNSSEGGNSFDTVIHADIADVAIIHCQEEEQEGTASDNLENIEDDPFQNGSSLI